MAVSPSSNSLTPMPLQIGPRAGRRRLSTALPRVGGGFWNRIHTLEFVEGLLEPLTRPQIVHIHARGELVRIVRTS